MVAEEDKPPKPGDLVGWRQAIREGRLAELEPETIVAALQTLGPKTDKHVVNALMQHIADRITRKLRRTISRRYPNEGNDIIEAAHSQLIQAVLQPKSADGKGLREAFEARVVNRALDALRKAKIGYDRERGVEMDEQAARADPAPSQEQAAHVSHLLDKIPDRRKRLAVMLAMQGAPKGSKKAFSIAEACGVTPETIDDWLEEVADLLKPFLLEKEDE